MENIQIKDDKNSSESVGTRDTTLLNRKNIESLGNRVRISDSNESGLELFCYVRCNPEDKGIIKQCRGIVFNKDDIVMRAFPYTIELSHDDDDKIKKYINDDFQKYSFYESHEGTLIRMFYFKDKWYTSTHRKLDAFHSKWASKESFGEIFLKCLEYQYKNNKKFKDSIPEGDNSLVDKFQNILDKKNQYMFLLMNSKENRIVCEVKDYNEMFHVGTFIDGNLSMEENINIPYPEKHNFNNVEELIDFVDNVNIQNIQGIICFDSNNEQIKILNKLYKELFNARGNEPSVKYRYLQVRMNRKIVEMLYHLYPDMERTFDEIENNIYEVAENIYTAYVQRFIKKRFVTVPSEEFLVIKECHKWHESDRTNNRISMEIVINTLNKQSSTNLNRMIRRLKNQKTSEVSNKITSKLRQRSNTLNSDNKNSPLLLSTDKSEIPKLDINM
jgi:hypothetical protein